MSNIPPRRPNFNPSNAIGGSQGGLFDAAPKEKPAITAAEPVEVAAESVQPTAKVAAPKEITVAQLSELVRGTLESMHGPLRVIGELSNVSERKHLYCSLKGENATINAVMWASELSRNRCALQDGQLVIATGRLTHYAPQGRTQFVVSKFEQAGVGDRELELKALFEELRKLGYLDAARKRRLPAFPQRVAIVTSRVGAAIDDVLKTASERSTLVEFVVFDVRVQGEGAAAEIAATMQFISQHHAALGVDLMLVTRGGGSREDLWAFNERVIADAAFTSRIPVLSAIGHEEDNSVLDYVADLRASTPTQAVLSIVPDRESLGEQLAQLERRLLRARDTALTQAQTELRALQRRLPSAIAARIAAERRRLESLSLRVAQHSPRAAASAARVELSAFAQRLASATQRTFATQRARIGTCSLRCVKAGTERIARERRALTAAQQRLAAVNPRSVLARGYSVVFRVDAHGKAVVKRATEVATGERVEVETGDGFFGARVE